MTLKDRAEAQLIARWLVRAFVMADRGDWYAAGKHVQLARSWNVEHSGPRLFDHAQRAVDQADAELFARFAAERFPEPDPEPGQ